MSFPLSWLYHQYGGSFPVGSERCYLCGASCAATYTVAAGIADTFNSHFLAVCPHSPYLCAACAWYLDGKADHPEFRKMSLVVTRQAWRNWERATMKQDIARWLAGGLPEDAYLVVSLSKKKHILLQAPLNVSSSSTLAVQIEEQVAYLTASVWGEMDAAFMALLELGHGKGEILSGALHPSVLRKHGRIAEALALSRQLERWRASSSLELLSYVTITENKEEAPHDGHRGRGDPPVSAGTRTASDRGGVSARRLQRDRVGRVGEISDDDLDDSRDDGSQCGPYVCQSALFPE